MGVGYSPLYIYYQLLVVTSSLTDITFKVCLYSTVVTDQTSWIIKCQNKCYSIENAYKLLDKSVLMIRAENCPDICFPIINLLILPLTMHVCIVTMSVQILIVSQVGR